MAQFRYRTFQLDVISDRPYDFLAGLRLALHDETAVHFSVTKNGPFMFSTDPDSYPFSRMGAPNTDRLCTPLGQQMSDWLSSLSPEEKRRVNTSTPIGNAPLQLIGFRLQCQRTHASPYLYGSFMPAWV